MCVCIVPVSACFVMSLSLIVVTQSCPTFCDPMAYSPQAPLSMKFSRQEFWSRLPFPSPGPLPSPGIEPRSPALQANSLLSEPPGKPKNTEVKPIPSPGDFPDPGIEPGSPAFADRFFNS